MEKVTRPGLYKEKGQSQNACPPALHFYQHALHPEAKCLCLGLVGHKLVHHRVGGTSPLRTLGVVSLLDGYMPRIWRQQAWLLASVSALWVITAGPCTFKLSGKSQFSCLVSEDKTSLRRL